MVTVGYFRIDAGGRRVSGRSSCYEPAAGPRSRESTMNQQPPENRGDDVLAEIIRRIVRVAAPQRIVLFGSAARREEGPVSDLDLLVIKPGRYHRRHLT